MTRYTPFFPGNEYNHTLPANVHPSGWTNPEPAPLYNLVVLGGGTAGLVTAAGAAALGARVALVERRLLGGDCLNFGCVPSKGLLKAGRVIHEARMAGEFGVSGNDGLTIDFGKAMERMRRLRAEISSHDSADRFSRELGVDLFFGNGAFSGPDTICVGGKTLRFKRAAVCTGTRPAVPAIPGLEEAGYLTNETVFSLTELPRRIAVIGGGPIACELGQAFCRMGSRVVMLGHVSDHLLPREDRDAAEILQNAFLREGIDIRVPAGITGVQMPGTEKVIKFTHDRTANEIPVDEILVAVGRTPELEGLNLEAAGIKHDPKTGVRVDDRLRTSNPRIYAAGDVCSAYKFTHAADAMARILIANALFGGRRKNSDLVIPWCTYTDPEIAHVGMHERDFEKKGTKVQTLTVPLSEIDRAVLDGESSGFARVHLKKGSDRILGATIVARHAGEMINEITLAMTAGLGISAIGRTIHPYPTQSEAIRKLADAYNRTRLTPLVSRLMKSWFSLSRR